jgi:hypothetical protein
VGFLIPGDIHSQLIGFANLGAYHLPLV